MLPNSARASPAFLSNEAESVRSSGKIRTFSSCPWQFSFTLCSSSLLRADRIKRFPFLLNSYAMASPRPDEAPVIHTTFFSRSIRLCCSLSGYNPHFFLITTDGKESYLQIIILRLKFYNKQPQVAKQHDSKTYYFTG